MIDQKALRLLWQKCEVGAATLDKDGYFTEVNDKICEMVEYTPAELIGKHFVDITLPSDQAPDKAMAGMLANGEIDHYKMTKTYLKKSGYPIQIDLVVYGVNRDDGTFEYFLSQMVPRVNISASNKRVAEIEVSPMAVLSNWLIQNKKFMMVVLATITAVMASFTALFEFLKAKL